MKFLVSVSIGLLVLVSTATGAAATTFTLSKFSVNAYESGDNGLGIGWDLADNLSLPKTFTLPEVGAHTTFHLFDIWTWETAVNYDDTIKRKIEANFGFSSPDFSGSVGGSTFGLSLFGLFDRGKVQWSNPTIFSYGTDPIGALSVSLSDETFNAGFFDLKSGASYGATVSAKFALVKEGGTSVPDASIMFLLGPALIGLGILGKRKHRLAGHQ